MHQAVRWTRWPVPSVRETLGQSVVFENRIGGNALIAADAVLAAPCDGYTFLIGAANHVTDPLRL